MYRLKEIINLGKDNCFLFAASWTRKSEKETCTKLNYALHRKKNVVALQAVVTMSTCIDFRNELQLIASAVLHRQSDSNSSHRFICLI